MLALALLAPAAPAGAARDSLVATADSPFQVVVVQLLEGGTTAPGTFESHLKAHRNGRADGWARLRYEEATPSGLRITTLDVNYLGAKLFELTKLHVYGTGRQCVGLVCADVRIAGSVHPEPSSPDCLIYDVVGPGGLFGYRVDATGTFVVSR